MTEERGPSKAGSRITCPIATAFLLLAALLPARGAPAEEPAPSPAVTALQSLKLSGYAQVLGAFQRDEADSFSIRRARVGLSGRPARNLRFRVVADLARSSILLDAAVEFQPVEPAGLRAGQFLVPFSLESTTSSADLDLINRSLTVEALAPGRDNGSAGRDIGAAAFGRLAFLEYTVGLFNGSGINRKDTDNHKDWAGRLVLRPFGGLSLGGSFYLGRESPFPEDPPARRNRMGLDASLFLSGLSIKGEYIHADTDLLSQAGWYAQAGYFALPDRLQAVVRYDAVDLDTAAPGSGRRVFTAGLNWVIFGRTKLQANYEHHGMEGGGTWSSGFLVQLQAGF